jgi:hypothetical protein
MTPEEIIDLVKFPNKKFSISASRARCIEYARWMQELGMHDQQICVMISTLYHDAFNEAEYQHMREKMTAEAPKPRLHG